MFNLLLYNASQQHQVILINTMSVCIPYDANSIMQVKIPYVNKGLCNASEQNVFLSLCNSQHSSKQF